MGDVVLSIDAGTTSVRCIAFGSDGHGYFRRMGGYDAAPADGDDVCLFTCSAGYHNGGNRCEKGGAFPVLTSQVRTSFVDRCIYSISAVLRIVSNSSRVSA